MAKHIVHVLYRFDVGGLENGVVNLINNLPDDYRHTIVTLKGSNPEFAARIHKHNVAYFDLGKKEGQDFGVFLRFNKLLKQLKPDVLHTRNLTSLEFQGIGWWRRIPSRIHGEHGWDIHDLNGTNKKYQKIRKLFEYFVCNYIALSSQIISYLTDRVGIAANKITHICNGVDISKFCPENPPAELDKFGADKNTVVFGTVGRLAAVKNQTLLVKAFIKMLSECPEFKQHCRLVIVGEGVLRQDIEKLVAEAGIQDLVLLTGNRKDVNGLMAAMDVFVLPSLAEGIPNTVLEAMATGLPVIATDVGGTKDLFHPRLAPTHLVGTDDVEKIAGLMSAYAESQQLINDHGQLNREHCENNFSIQNMVNKYHQLYQSF